jgi:hypothetical protein
MRLLTELGIVVYLRVADDLEQLASRLFGTLGTEWKISNTSSGRQAQGRGLGFQAVLAAHEGENLDPEFQQYGHRLEIISAYADVDLDPFDLENPLSEYFARQIAFDLNIETATEILVEANDEEEVYEVRAYKRNPQYRLDQSPTTPKVFVIETRELREPLVDEEAEESAANEQLAER